MFIDIHTRYIKHVFLLFACVFTVYTAEGQPLRKWEQAAEKSYLTKDYYSALKYYQVVIDFDSSKAEPWYRMAYSAREIHAYSLARTGFQKVIDLKEEKNFPLNRFYLADVENHLGEFVEAEKNYLVFLRSNDRIEPEYLFKAERGIKNCRWAREEIQHNRMNIALSKPDPRINTGYSEFGAALRKDTIWYTSYRFDEKDDKHWPRRKYFKIMAFAPGDSLGQGQLYDEWNVEGKHTAHVTFNSKEDLMYYSICEYADSTSDLECEIYRRALVEGRWSSPEPAEEINLEGYNTFQPNLGRDARNGKEWLFFSSNRPGGKGLKDIWYAELNPDGSLSKPANLEAVNTRGDEVSPFFHNPSQRLYFSTDGRLTFGGLDVFRSDRVAGNWTVPEQMGYPLNGTYDDAYFSLNDEGNVALLASNRLGSTFLEPEAEACCFDIWQVDYKVEVALDVLTFHKATRDKLNGVRVELFELDQFSGTETLVADLTNPDGNKFEFSIFLHKQYVVKGSKPGWTSDLDSINLVHAEPGTVTRVQKELYLGPAGDLATRGGPPLNGGEVVDLEVLTFDELSREPVIGCRVSLAPLDSMIGLETIEKYNPSGNDYLFPLVIDQPYLLTTTHPEYRTKSDTLLFTRSDLQTYGNRVTVEVYLRKLFDCLPLVLFFDNNVPGPAGYEPETSVNYEETFHAYFKKKEEYIEKLTEGLGEDEAFDQEQIMQLFFERTVKEEGYEDLHTCTRSLLNYLEKGNAAALQIDGSASPRGPSAYNQVLSQRRINSVINFLSTFDKGALKPYIDNGMLIIEENPKGEDRSGNPNLLDDLEDFDNVRTSIYSLPACLPRSVEISRIEIKPQTSKNNEKNMHP